MSFRIEAAPKASGLLITPGTTFRVLATSETVRSHLTDSYWCEILEDFCEGKLEGVAVRYTGKNVVLIQFRPNQLTSSGHRFPVAVSIPSEFLVPSAPATDLATSFAFRRGVTSIDFQSSFTTYPSEIDSVTHSVGSEVDLPKLCVVCGRFDVPDMQKRKSGWKCKGCKGTQSSERLRYEASKLPSIL